MSVSRNAKKNQQKKNLFPSLIAIGFKSANLCKNEYKSNFTEAALSHNFKNFNLS